MNPLTIKHAIENGFNAFDCVRYFKPEFTDAECDFIISEYTSYPLYGKDILVRQLNTLFIK